MSGDATERHLEAEGKIERGSRAPFLAVGPEIPGGGGTPGGGGAATFRGLPYYPADRQRDEDRVFLVRTLAMHAALVAIGGHQLGAPDPEILATRYHDCIDRFIATGPIGSAGTPRPVDPKAGHNADRTTAGGGAAAGST